jgi:hypothetical protein
MSKQSAISTEAQLRDVICALWAEDSALNWRWKSREPRREQGMDAVVEVILDKRRLTFAVKFKLNPAARDVEYLARQKFPHPLLLVAPNISETLARFCREKGLSCADLNGRLRLRAEGLFVEREPKLARYRPALATPDPFSVKGSRLARTLLSYRDRKWTHKELVSRTGLSKGLVSRLARHLVDQGLLAREERGLQVKRWDALLDAWAAADDWRKRTTVQQYSLLDSDLEAVGRRLLKALPASEPLAFTQWFAANLRYPYTIAPVVSAYVARFPTEQDQREWRVRQVADGGTLWLIVPKDDGVFRETQRVGELTLASDAQIYLDLLHAGLRGPEQAKALRDWAEFGRVKA